MKLTDEQLIDVASRPTIVLEVEVPDRALSSIRALKAHLRKRYGLDWTPEDDADVPGGLFYGADLRSYCGHVRDYEGSPIEMEIYNVWATVPEEEGTESVLKARGRQQDRIQWPEFVRLIEDSTAIKDAADRVLHEDVEQQQVEFTARDAAMRRQRAGVRPQVSRRTRRSRGPGPGWWRQPREHARAARLGHARRRR